MPPTRIIVTNIVPQNVRFKADLFGKGTVFEYECLINAACDVDVAAQMVVIVDAWIASNIVTNISNGQKITLTNEQLNVIGQVVKNSIPAIDINEPAIKNAAWQIAQENKEPRIKFADSGSCARVLLILIIFILIAIFLSLR